MRLILLSLSLGLAMPAMAGVPPIGSGAAPSPVRTQPLAPGELLLELGAIGTATRPADAATLSATLTGGGATDAAARAELRVREQRVTDAMRGAGVPAVSISRETVMVFNVSEEPPPPDEVGVASGPPPPPALRHASSRVTVRVADIARLAAVRAALAEAADEDAAGGGQVSQPAYSLSDPGPARRAARAQALARLRAEADAYAAALNMRVARIVRITERSGFDLLGLALTEAPTLMRRGFNPETNRDPDVDVAVMVGVDFALAPR